MGIQLKPAANICFDAAAAAAGQAGQAGAAGGARCARQSRGWNARGGARPSDRRPPSSGPGRASGSRAETEPVLPRGRPGASCGAQTQLCGPPAPRPFDPGRGAVGSPQPGLEVTGQGREQGGTDTDRTPGYTHSLIPHIYSAPTAVPGAVWRRGTEPRVNWTPPAPLTSFCSTGPGDGLQIGTSAQAACRV